MRKILALTALCASACITIAQPSTFRTPPIASAVVFGRFHVDGKPPKELRLGRFGDILLETGVNALIDPEGNFAFVVEPGAYYLHWYEPEGAQTRIFESDAQPDPVFHFEVGAGELHWLGAWEEAAHGEQRVKLERIEAVEPAEVLKPLARTAAGTAWEMTLRAELKRLSP